MKKWIVLSLALLLSVACGDDGTGVTGDAQNPTSDAAPGADAVPGADAPVADAAADAAPGADAHPGADAIPGADAAVGVECGPMVCAPNQECCITNVAGTPQYECIAIGDTCDGVSAECDGPEDCGGNACCATLIGMTATATCDTQTECTGGLTLCHTGADCPTASPNCCALPGTSASACTAAMCLP